MTQSLQKVIAEVQKRSDEEQDFIAALILEELSAQDIPQSHKEELDRRLAAYQDNPDAGSPWEEVKARLQGGA